MLYCAQLLPNPKAESAVPKYCSDHLSTVKLTVWLKLRNHVFPDVWKGEPLRSSFSVTECQDATATLLFLPLTCLCVSRILVMFSCSDSLLIFFFSAAYVLNMSAF